MNFKLSTEFCSYILCTRSNALLRFTVQTAVFLSVNSTIVTCKKYSPACRKSLVFKLNLLPKVYAGYNIVRWKTRTWNVPNLKKTMWENERDQVLRLWVGFDSINTKPHPKNLTLKGTVSWKLRWVLLYINLKLFSRADVAHHKISN